MLTNQTTATKANLIWLLLGLILGLGLTAFQIVGHEFSYFPGDLVDGRLNLYFLEHVYNYISGNVSSFWDVPFMYPEKNVLAYSDNLIGSSPIYILFRLLQFNNHHSYQLWYLTVTSLNYLCAFYFLNYLFKNNQAAILGAFVFAFSLALQSQLTHAQTFPRFAIPMAFLAALKFKENLNLKYLLCALLWVVYQIYCAMYLGLMLAIPLGIYLGIILCDSIFIKNNFKITFRWFLKASGISIIILTLLMFLLIHYLKRSNNPGFAHYLSIIESVPTLSSYFFSQYGSLFWNALSKSSETTKAWWDHQIFSGLLTTLAFVVGFGVVIKNLIKNKLNVFKLNTIHQLMFVGLLLFFIYLRIQNYSLYLCFYYLPGFSAMRSMTRIINIELLFFSISLAYLYLKYSSLKIYNNNLFFILLLAFLCADNYFFPKYSHRTELTASLKRLHSLEKTCEKLPHNSIISYEPKGINLNEAKAVHLDAMLVSQKFGLKCLNGYTGNCPSSFKNFMNYPSTENRKVWLKEKLLDADTLYVIRSYNVIDKINLSNYYEENPIITKQEKLIKLINDIRSNGDLMKQIEIKAKKRNIQVNTMVVLDALWLYKHETQTAY